jgi:GT2 family glycosyltransferase
VPSVQVTVAVVSWNTRELLAACLRSLAGEEAEVWVVDNASSDGSAEMVRAQFPAVKLVAQPENVGFGAAVNVVAGRTSSPWLAAANADVALRPGALRALLDAGAADPGAGAVAPRLVLPDGTTQHSVFPFPTVPFTAAFNLGVARSDVLIGRWDPDRPRRVPWAIAAFLLVRREAWEAVGGFDEGQWMYAEDLDLGWRLNRAGWATRYEPRAVVEHHDAAATAQAWGEARVERWQRATYAWMLRRRGAARTRAVAALNVAGAAARWAPLAAAARVQPERFAYRRDVQRRWMRTHASGLAPRAELEGWR